GQRAGVTGQLGGGQTDGNSGTATDRRCPRAVEGFHGRQGACVRTRARGVDDGGRAVQVVARAAVQHTAYGGATRGGGLAQHGRGAQGGGQSGRDGQVAPAVGGDGPAADNVPGSVQQDEAAEAEVGAHLRGRQQTRH